MPNKNIHIEHSSASLSFYRRSVSVLLIITLMNGCATFGGRGGDDDASSDRDDDGLILGTLLISGVIWGINEYKNSHSNKETINIEKENLYLSPARTSVYEKLIYIGSEPENFGVYTYVLFGKYPSDIHSDIYKKYKNILEIIQEKPYWEEYKKPVSANTKNATSEINTKSINLYLIPSTEGHSKRIVSVSDYNYDFSIRLLREYIDKRTSKNTNGKFLAEGPFLLSLPNTIQNNNKQYMLFADFTGVKEELYREIFYSYEGALKTGSNAGKDPFGIIENIRIKIGHKLVEFNDVFKVIGQAYADE